MDAIEKDRSGSTHCMLELVSKWVYRNNDTGDLPRTWTTVVKAVKSSGHGKLAEDLAKKYGVSLA